MARLDVEEVKSQASLRRFCEENLERVGHTYACPCCGSGTGRNHTSAFTIYEEDGRESWKCHACGEGGDILDLYGVVRGCEDDFGEKIRGVAEFAGIDAGKEGGAPRRPPRPARPKGPSPERVAEIRSWRERFQARLEACAARVDDPRARACLESHGLDVEAARRHGLGFTDRYRMGWSSYPAVLIPYEGAPWYYTARILDDGAPHKYDRPSSSKVGETPIWNAKALSGDEVVIVEGQFDAIAVEEAGVPAIALGTTGSRRLLQEMRERDFSGVALVMLDHDRAGAEGRARLMAEVKGLREEGLEAFPYEFRWPEGAPKDAAEWLAKDRASLRRELSSAFERGWRRKRAAGDDVPARPAPARHGLEDRGHARETGTPAR